MSAVSRERSSDPFLKASRFTTWLFVVAAMTRVLPAHAQHSSGDREPPVHLSATWGLMLGAGMAILMIPMPIALAARRDAGTDLRHPQRSVGDSDPSVTDALRHRLIDQWQNTRPPPYVYASVGAAIATAAVVSIQLLYEPELVSRWLVALGGIVGLGVATWGIVDVARGGSCDVDRRQVRCSTALELRDEGALRIIASAPLLSIPVTHLLRRSSAPKSRQTVDVSLSPQTLPEQRAALLNARIQWL